LKKASDKNKTAALMENPIKHLKAKKRYLIISRITEDQAVLKLPDI